MSSQVVWCSFTLSWVLMAGPALPQESAPDSAAQDEAATKPDEKVDQKTDYRWYKKLGWQWGGYLKGKTNVSWPSDNSYLSAVSTGPLLDGNTEFRLKNTTNFGQRFSLETHFESILAGGDTRSRSSQLVQVNPYLAAYALEQIRPVDDRRRLMDLTALSQGEGYILSNRLDRLVLTYKPDWGFVRVGRQAVTWGNGMLFTPLDIFDPFAPTDIEREYKIGEDMLSVQVPSRWGEFQFLGVARREPLTHSVQLNQSSFAGKWHKGLGKVDLDLMAGRHFSDDVIGFGSSQPLGGAGWRLDATWTFLGSDSRRAGYLALVTNVDYSWVWFSKNFYGYVEFYFNGLGTTQYDLASLDPALLARLARREMFTIGRYYADSKVQVEVNPLFNVYVSSIVNLYDGSGIFQPRGIWSMTTDLLLTFGANLVWGKPGTEFGGVEIPTTQHTNRAAAGVFVWLSYYF